MNALTTGHTHSIRALLRDRLLCETCLLYPHPPRNRRGRFGAAKKSKESERERDESRCVCAPFFLETRTAAAIIYFFSMGTNERIVSQSRAFMSSSGRDYVVGMRRREGEA